MGDEDRDARLGAIADAMVQTPYLAGLGVAFERFAPDEVVLRLPFQPGLTNDGHRYHGGVVAAALDTAGAGAALSNHDFSKGGRPSTVSVSVQFVGSAVDSDLICTARTLRRVKELVFTEIHATDAQGRAVAHAVQTYRIG